MNAREEIPFTSLGARSHTLVIGASMVLVVESAALHALLLHRWPLLSLVLVLLNLWTIWWLVQDYRAIATRPTLVRSEDVLLRLGRRTQGVVPYRDIVEVIRPTWQQVPAVGTPEYIKMSGMDDPNVLVRLAQPATFLGVFGVRKRGNTVGLRLDNADHFVRALTERLRSSRI